MFLKASNGPSLLIVLEKFELQVLIWLWTPCVLWSLIIYFSLYSTRKVQYTATIEGKSPLGNLIRYTHAGNKTAPANANRIELDPLRPDTSYLFRVAVLTARGEGMQVETRGNTNMGASQFGKNSLAYQYY